LGSWSRSSLALLLLLAAAQLSAAQLEQGYVVVTVYGEPAECLPRVVLFSNTRNMPVRLSKVGEATWVSEPVPRGELVTVSYEQAPNCFNYVAVNEDTLEKLYNVDRIAVYATYNATIAIKANLYPPQTQQTATASGEPPLTSVLEQIQKAAPAVAPYALAIVAAYAGLRISKTALQRSRRSRAEQQSLKKAISSLKQSSKNPVIKRGWIWMDVDPAYEVVHGTDPDRKIASFLKLARVLPAGRERMERIFRETLDRAYTPAIIGYGAGHAGVDPGEDLVWYAVELAQDDPEIDRALARIEKAGVDPYIIPAELAGLDEIIKTYRGRPMEDLGFRYGSLHREKVETDTCPLCGNKTLKGARYCTYCGREIRKPDVKPVTKSPSKQCPTCGRPIPPNAQYCRECTSPSPPAGRGEPAHPPQHAEPAKPAQPPSQAGMGGLEAPKPAPEPGQEPAWKAAEQPRRLETAQSEGEKNRPQERAATPPAPPQATPEPEKPAPPAEGPEPAWPDIEWEPGEDLLEELNNLGVDAGAFRAEALRLARLSEDDKSYRRELMRSADRLASAVEGLDDDFRSQVMLSLYQHLAYAALAIRKELKPPEPPAPKAPPKAPPKPMEAAKPQAAQETPKPAPEPAKPAVEAGPAGAPVKPAAMQEIVTEVGYMALLEAGAEPGYVYILDLPRSAVPTSVVTSQVRNTINIEEASGAGPAAVLALTRTNYRANYKSMIRPSPNHPYVRRLAKLVSSGAGGGVITTSEIYDMLRDAFNARGFKPVAVRLDTDRVAEELEKAVGAGYAKKLAKLVALMPGLKNDLTNSDEALRKRLHDALGSEDGEDLYQAVRAVFSGDTRYVNKPLMLSLGMLDEAG